ncbi:telomerase reverse transcriptase isoform X1 [Cynoglossus semilaevis]|uniref:telomerase reverse transcriptase isoform X1 n=2 Tax=Cynoglossus semilaevis TaxID=244447 RepID=UPI000D624814|nr:telomerase reverse transcriptase isoform X1 [Cynoglossus semilaevis]
MKRKKKNNVLINGYKPLSAQEECNADQFKFQGRLFQSAAYIHSSDLWKNVLLRLGTDVARYLLESCSVFVAVAPSCVFQVCGVPVYEKMSVPAVSTRFYLQNRGQARKGTKFGSRRRSMTWKRSHKGGKCRVNESMDRRKCSGNNRKRKRKNDGRENTQAKRRKLEKQESIQGCSKMEEGVQSVTGEQTSTVQPSVHVTKQPIPQSEREHDWSASNISPSQCFIRTLGILYGGRGMRSFLLNRKRKTDLGPKSLQGADVVRIIFFEGLAYLNGTQRKPKKLPRRFFNMVPLFCQLLQQHRTCPYNRLLQRMCPVVEGTGEEQTEMISLLPQHCAPHRVYLFVRKCLSVVIPPELWGSDYNRAHFFARVRRFLHGGKYEGLSLSELLWKIKVNDCHWLMISKTARVPPSELSYRTQVLGKFFAWVLGGFVTSLVRSCFHVTESMSQKNALRFYRQEVWDKLQDLAFRCHLSKGQMEELTPAQVASLPKGTVISRLRFIPKTDGMRPITRVIGADPKTRFYKGISRNLLEILRACVDSTPSLLGSTVWGMMDIHKVLAAWAPAQKMMPQSLYFVKVDVSGAYESLPHDKLTEVVDQAVSPLKSELLLIRRYAKIWANSHEGLKKAFVRQVSFLKEVGGTMNMKGFVTWQQRIGKVHHAILVEQHFTSDLQGEHAYQFLVQMLTGSVVQFGRKTYRQCRGIPQGSVVSSLLCCLCYGHMENVLFKDITKNGCLMRLVDDFLFITRDLHEAQEFLKVLLAGIPQYGLVVNPQKVVINFDVPDCLPSASDIHVLPTHCLFPWCGLLLDTRSLDVYKDYSSYAGLSMRYSLTLGSSHAAGQQMRRKLMAILRFRCHPLFVDLKTNSFEAVYKNVYKLVLLQAYRFRVCAQSLPFGQTVAKNPGYFLQMIGDMIDYTDHLIRLSNKGLVLGTKAQTGPVQREAVELIFSLSFLKVLSPHRSLYKDLLSHLHKRKRSLEQSLGDLRLARVRQAAEPRIPADFLAIKM